VLTFRCVFNHLLWLWDFCGCFRHRCLRFGLHECKSTWLRLGWCLHKGEAARLFCWLCLLLLLLFLMCFWLWCHEGEATRLSRFNLLLLHCRFWLKLWLWLLLCLHKGEAAWLFCWFNFFLLFFNFRLWLHEGEAASGWFLRGQSRLLDSKHA